MLDEFLGSFQFVPTNLGDKSTIFEKVQLLFHRSSNPEIRKIDERNHRKHMGFHRLATPYDKLF